MSITAEVVEAEPVAFGRGKAIAFARATTLLMGCISFVVGMGIIVYDGLYASLSQHQLFWFLLGGVAFALPGMLYLAAWWSLVNGRRLPLIAAIVAASFQALLSLALAFGHGLGKLPTSGFVIAESLLWFGACVILIWQLKRALPWVETDAEAHHGFEVQSAKDHSELM
jgi:hypothetical protein